MTLDDLPNDLELIEPESIDIDKLLAADENLRLQPTEAWLDTIESGNGFAGAHFHSAGRIDQHADDQEWLVGELLTLFVRHQRETEAGILEFAAALDATQDVLLDVADVAIHHEAERQGRLDELLGAAQTDE